MTPGPLLRWAIRKVLGGEPRSAPMLRRLFSRPDKIELARMEDAEAESKNDRYPGA